MRWSRPAGWAFMRWSRTCWVIVILVSGCASTGVDGPSSPHVPCPTVGNATLACEETLPALDVQLEPPRLADGWGCVIDHDDEAPQQFFRLHRHVDGRLGYSWRWPTPDWDHRFITMALVEPDRVTWATADHLPEGFAQLPATPQAQAGEAQITVLALRLDQLVNNSWQPIEGARLDRAVVDGVGYFVWSWADGDEVVHLDIMAPHDERIWTPRPVVQEVGGRTVSAAVKAASSSFGAQYWGVERTLFGDCTAEALGVPP